MKKGFAHIEILFVTLAIAVLGVTAFVVNRNSEIVSHSNPAFSDKMNFTSSDTEGWKKYSNYRCDDVRGESSFSIEVPSDWNVEDTITDDNSSFHKYEFTSPDEESVTITCGDGLSSGSGCGESEDISVDVVRVGAIHAAACVYKRNGIYSVAPVINALNATFIVSVVGKDNSDSISLLNRILSTFEFVPYYETINREKCEEKGGTFEGPKDCMGVSMDDCESIGGHVLHGDDFLNGTATTICILPGR